MRKRMFALILLTALALAVSASAEGAEPEITVPEGYHLVWSEEFDGEKLNREDWMYETHEPGWVNSELQRYVATEEVAYLENGELVIQPVKDTDSNGKTVYRSGRVNTWGRHEIQYGWIEARIRVPEGKGFLPAFWMMPHNEGLYGSWPRCGEIDIMEVLGDKTKKLYGTLHFGEPHTQRQGTYRLSEGDFSKEYHVFAVEWEPSEIRWYVDGIQYYQVSDWFTAKQGQQEKPYPAPFNQPFYVILNVAVGGNWARSPGSSTVFDERAAMRVDYVRFFQKDSYDENVARPEQALEMREADTTGNYVRNGDFSQAEDLADETDWAFLLASGGEGSAEIADHEIVITSGAAGSEEYSVQLVQPGMPMEQGARYIFSFEACAEEERTMKPAITAPDVNWARYLNDTAVTLTPEWQTYTFEFEMTMRSDDNGRVEFNMGRQGSTAAIHIRNVRLTKAE